MKGMESLKVPLPFSRSLIETSLDPFVTISTEGKITDANEASIRITGISRELLIGSDFANYFIEPEKVKEGYRQVFKNGFVSNYPLTIRHKNGNLSDVLYNASVYKDGEGNILGVIAAARNVTEFKQASKYARSLIEASLDPLITINAAGKITDVNEASVNITGVEREKLVGSDFFDYFTDPQKAREVYQNVFTNGSVANSPLRLCHKNGRLTDVLFNGSVYKNDRGEILGVVIVARDVTEQKRIETEFTEARVFAEMATSIAEIAKDKAEQATLRAESAVKAKQQFLSNMSHEIRTPLNAIIGFTKVLLKTDLTAKQKEYLSAIQLSGDALTVLINDILDLAKVDSGKMEFEKIPFKMNQSISAMLHLFETRIQEKNLKLVKEIDSRIPEVLVGDPLRLHQIILNLVSNAVKFTARGEIRMLVKLIEETAENATIGFEISDTGIGIPENKLDQIFESFQQASSGTARLFGGTGLGLAIAKQLVKRQGGNIHAKSKIDVGSTFEFVLCFQKLKQDAITEIEIIEPDKGIKHIRVLIVEDIALNQLLLKTLLDEFGFDRDVAANGLIAIEKLKSSSYDVILMDLQMPELNGFETTAYIRNTMLSKIPIIALTADVTTVDLEKCKAVGMNDYLSKPVNEKILCSKIISLVKKSPEVNRFEQPGAGLGAPGMNKCTDLRYLTRHTRNNTTLMMEMISLYLDQTPYLMKEIKRSLVDKDWPAFKSTLHKIIPSFSIVGIDKKYELMAKNLLEMDVSGNQLELINHQVDQLENICTQAVRELSEEFNRLKMVTK